MAYRDIGVRVQNPCYQRQKLRSVRPIWMYVCANGKYTNLSLWLAIAQHPESMWNVRAGSKKQQSIIRYYRIQMCVSKPCMQHAALWLAGFRQSSCARTLLMPSAESLADFIVLVVAL